MCNLYSITTNQEAIIRLFRNVNRYVGNLAPMPGVFLADFVDAIVHGILQFAEAIIRMNRGQ